MSKKLIPSWEVAAATNEDLAQCILDQADGSPVGNSFAVTAAVELAKRILPNGKLVDKAPQNPIFMDAGGGKAPASRVEKRVNESIYQTLTQEKSGTKLYGGTK